jgi:uncharacterized protein (TIGR02147 family)
MELNYNGIMPNIFRHLDYREILKILVNDRKKSDPHFNFSVLAKALGVQKTFLSMVMNSKSHLSTDQLFSLTEFFGLAKQQHDYLILLLEYEKTGLAKRKKILRNRIAAIQLEHRSPKKVMQSEFIESTSNDAFAAYYLDPFMTIVHQYLALPEFGGDPKKVAQSLGITDRSIKKIVQTLISLQLIVPATTPGAYRVSKENLWLSPDSPLNSAYYGLFRQISAYQLAKTPRDQRSVFSITFSADDKSRGLIHDAFLKFLREMESIVKVADSKEVYQINFDLFPWR